VIYGGVAMTLKERNTLVFLDSIIILLSIIEIGIASIISTYCRNENMAYLFLGITVICTIMAIKSVKCIYKKEA